MLFWYIDLWLSYCQSRHGKPRLGLPPSGRKGPLLVHANVAPIYQRTNNGACHTCTPLEPPTCSQRLENNESCNDVQAAKCRACGGLRPSTNSGVPATSPTRPNVLHSLLDRPCVADASQNRIRCTSMICSSSSAALSPQRRRPACCRARRDPWRCPRRIGSARPLQKGLGTYTQDLANLKYIGPAGGLLRRTGRASTLFCVGGKRPKVVGATCATCSPGPGSSVSAYSMPGREPLSKGAIDICF